MDTTVKRILWSLSGNAPTQRLLEFGMNAAQYLMGIGPGASPAASGERVLAQLLRRGGSADSPLCIFDVGANQGQFALMMIRELQGTPCVIHSFEPGRETFAILERNTAALSNVVRNNVGLGASGGEAELFYDFAGSGLASLSKRRMDHFDVSFERSERVRIDTLDAYRARLGVERIDLLKLDVEGHELQVLQGGSATFAEQRVDRVAFEFGGCNIDSRSFLQDFFYLFEQHGFDRIYRITPSGFLAHLPSYKEMYEQFRTTNFLAARKGVPLSR